MQIMKEQWLKVKELTAILDQITLVNIGRKKDGAWYIYP